MFHYEGQTETERCFVGLSNLMSRMASEDEGIIGYRKSKKRWFSHMESNNSNIKMQRLYTLFYTEYSRE